jgi:protocatechuate 3,4-dioxygenase beta subunit
MLTINHDPLGRGYKIKSVPKCLLITVGTAHDVSLVTEHYFKGHGQLQNCPLCRQIDAERKATSAAQ